MSPPINGSRHRLCSKDTCKGDSLIAIQSQLTLAMKIFPREIRLPLLNVLRQPVLQRRRSDKITTTKLIKLRNQRDDDFQSVIGVDKSLRLNTYRR